MKQKLTFIRLEKTLYKLSEFGDDSTDTLAIFLQDGLGYDSYANFLIDNNRQSFGGNISMMKKVGRMVIVTIDDDIIPDAEPLTISIENLLTVLKEWHRLRLLEVDGIEIVLDDSLLTVTSH